MTDDYRYFKTGTVRRMLAHHRAKVDSLVDEWISGAHDKVIRRKVSERMRSQRYIIRRIMKELRRRHIEATEGE